MIELQIVPKPAPQEDTTLLAALKSARKFLGVSEHSGKRTIKNSIYENFHWKKNTIGKTQQQFESAIAFVLKHHNPPNTKKAKAARAQEAADDKVRSEFRSKLWKAERAQALVVDADLASTRRVLRNIYENLSPKEKMAFIKIAGNVFNLTRREKTAMEKLEAKHRAIWEDDRATRETVQNALNVYHKEQNATKKAALWKTYLALTKPERDKKVATKKAEEKRIADGLANVETMKVSDPSAWSQAVAAATKAVALTVLGRYFYGAQLREGKGHVGSYAGSLPEGVQKVQNVIMSMAEMSAERKLAVVPEDEFPQFADDLNGYLDAFCCAGGLKIRHLVPELEAYALALVHDNWDVILKVGTYLLASGNINNSRTLRKVARTEFQKPAFQFSPAFATLGALLPTELTRPAQSVSPQQAAAITAAARALAN